VLEHIMGQAHLFADDTPLPTLERGRGRTPRRHLLGFAASSSIRLWIRFVHAT